MNKCQFNVLVMHHTVFTDSIYTKSPHPPWQASGLRELIQSAILAEFTDTFRVFTVGDLCELSHRCLYIE